jgi:hypothetical protein
VLEEWFDALKLSIRGNETRERESKTIVEELVKPQNIAVSIAS